MRHDNRGFSSPVSLMDDNSTDRIIRSLQKAQHDRNEQDIQLVHGHFSCQPWFQQLKDAEIEGLCLRGRYERHGVGSVLYRKGERIRNWYVLESGNVIIGTLLFSAPNCFGRKTSTSTRVDDCLVLDPSEIIVVDYHDKEEEDSPPVQRSSQTKRHPLNKSCSFSGSEYNSITRRKNESRFVEGPSLLYENLMMAVETESDSVSLFSARGSDAPTSSTGDPMVDLTGLMESTVDSEDEDEDSEAEEEEKEKTKQRKVAVNDVAEVVKRSRKTEKEVDLILNHVQLLPAFNNMTSNVRRALCSVLEYRQVESMHERILSVGDPLQHWIVILQGIVEVEVEEDITYLNAGECFGVKPTEDIQSSEQQYTTKSEKCQFLLVRQEDYCRILNEGEKSIKKVYKDGEVVLVLERREVGGREVPVVIRGEPYRLLRELFHQDEHDPTYVRDFLLTYRTFFNRPAQVAYKILGYLDDPESREKVVSIYLDWMNRHYGDFEDDVEMRTFLEHLERSLDDLGMTEELDLLTSTCAHLSRPRVVVVNRKSRDERLHFQLEAAEGGGGRCSSFFVGRVEEGSREQEAGLGRGDQILEVNTKEFKNLTLHEANSFLAGTTHLSMTVKYNMHEYKQLQRKSHKKTNNNNNNSNNNNNFGKPPQSHKDLLRVPVSNLPLDLEDPKKPQMFGRLKERLMRIVPAGPRLGHLPSSCDLLEGTRGQPPRSSGTMLSGAARRFGASQPDLSTLHLHLRCFDSGSDFVVENDLNVLKIFREDQSSRYIIVDKDITAQQVVMLAVKEFGLLHTSRDFALYEVTFHSENCIKQKRLPNNLTNLAERSSFRSRYYIKHTTEGSCNLLPEDYQEEMKKECQLNFLSLNCAEVAAQLTYRDFEAFARIPQAEYIEELFGVREGSKPSCLKRFSKLANEEMFWVVTHVCTEQNPSNRVKAIKHFIQIAKHCVECKNFNSAFAIVSGLGHQSVSRLKQTWERLPSKSLKLFEELQSLMDPSRNMSRYRSIIGSERPPLIPFFPLVMKDLTFIHLGNDSMVEGLVNFEKLRMISKQVRHTTSLAPAPNTINYSSLNSSATAMMRRKVNDFSMMNRKKLFEEAQMVRRVRAYLGSHKLVEDENQLLEMSNCCEPPEMGTRRFHLLSSSSPMPISLTTSTGPKFGTNSPENIKKLVALSAGSRPFGGSTEELLKPAIIEDHRVVRTRSSLNLPQSLTLAPSSPATGSTGTAASGSRFYLDADPSRSGPSFCPQNKTRNLSKETDSGRYSCSGDDGSTGSAGSNRGSPLPSDGTGTKAARGTSGGHVPRSSRPYLEDFATRLKLGTSSSSYAPMHVTVDCTAKRKRNHQFRMAPTRFQAKHDYV